MVVMALAAAKAIEIFLYYIVPTTGEEVLRDWSHFYSRDVMLFIVFMVTIIRFYHGDSRYLERKYLEFPLHTFNPKDYSSIIRFTNIFWLAVHAILFYYLAASQRDFPLYFSIFGGLLLFNAVWLVITYILTPNKENLKYPLYWAVNNIIHVGFLIGLYFGTNELEASYSYIIFSTLAISNSFIDYLTAWPYYFPKIVEATQEPPTTEPRSSTEGKNASY
jgi:hypothetical protein